MSPKKFSLLIIPLTIIFLLTLIFSQCTQTEDTRFEVYTNNLFCQEVQSNGITLHYTLQNPEHFQIHNIPANLGSVSTDTAAMGAAAENALATLHLYNPARLSAENQLIYTLLERNFLFAQNMAEFALYEEPLSPLTGTQSQLPILLSEYQFYSKADVDTYLKLLKNLPDYFQEIMNFETEKSKQGLFMNSKRTDAVIEECKAFVNMGDNHYLHETFKNRLRPLNLTEKEYQSYIQQNNSIIKEYVYPAYEALINHLKTLKNTGVNKNGLYYFPKGKEYYELLVKNITGSDRTILELQTLTISQINKDLDAMQQTLDKISTFMQEHSSENTHSNSGDVGVILQDSNPSSVLLTLKKNLKNNFPLPPDVNISVKYVDESMEEYLSPAFYLIPTIDNTTENTIYINPSHMNDDLTLFTTLAHEGYPGHLYQTTYFNNTTPQPIRQLLGCSGYVEGWATYCEMMSYYFIPASSNDSLSSQEQHKAELTLQQKNASIMLGLYALADIGIHYEGWTLIDTIDFFSEYGIYDTDAIEEIFNLIIGDPANYLKYYIGYVEFLELKKDAISTWGDDFTQERFHKEILELGPVPFTVLRKAMGLTH